MASEALSIPSDIAWQRLAWSRDMLDLPGGHMPLKWKSSVAIYAYPVPLSDTEEDYPDHRIIYLKLSLTITGWTRSEVIPEAASLPDGLDEWQRNAWDFVTNVPGVSAYMCRWSRESA